MNYRHHFHAGNFADVVKHVLLAALFRHLQRKEKGFLYLDTHAGRGSYDLAQSETGASLKRRPEFPDGVGRLWSAGELPGPVAEYLALVRGFDRERGNPGPGPRYYPGSPRLARLLARAQDRLALCEKHPADLLALQAEFARDPRTSVHDLDGYTAPRAFLPPPERRALVLIDPPFESATEWLDAAAAVEAAVGRMPASVVAAWYPLTDRARVDAFLGSIRTPALPPTLTVEVAIAGPDAGLRMRGCGLAIVNPPWGFEAIAKAVAEDLAVRLAQAAGAEAGVHWLVPET